MSIQCNESGNVYWLSVIKTAGGFNVTNRLLVYSVIK